MECPYCKEEIKDSAKKCVKCGEILKGWGKVNFFFKIIVGVLSVLIPVFTTSIAILEHVDKLRVEKEKAIVEIEKQATDEVLETIAKKVPKEAIERAATEDLKAAQPSLDTGIRRLKTNPNVALREFDRVVKKDPKSIDARKGAIYSKILTQKK